MDLQKSNMTVLAQIVKLTVASQKPDDEALFRFTSQYEALRVAPYDLSSIALCATDD